MSVFSYQYLLLELHHFPSTWRTRVTFNAEHHAGLEFTIETFLIKILTMHDQRVLVAQADTVGNRGLLKGRIRIRESPGIVADITKTTPCTEQLAVSRHLFVREIVKLALLSRGLLVADDPAA